MECDELPKSSSEPQVCDLEMTVFSGRILKSKGGYGRNVIGEIGGFFRLTAQECLRSGKRLVKAVCSKQDDLELFNVTF